MEYHVGIRKTTTLVNKHIREQGDKRVSVSASISAFYQLQLNINIIEKVVSGGLNEDEINASYNILKQMQILIRQLSDDEIMTDKEGKRGW